MLSRSIALPNNICAGVQFMLSCIDEFIMRCAIGKFCDQFEMKFFSNTRPRKCRYTSLFARSTIAFSSFEYGGAILNFCVEPNRIVKLLEELLESRGHKLIFPPNFIVSSIL